MKDAAPVTPAMARTCLVLGGARSGKSAYAQALAEATPLSPVYLATATIWDGEMAERVERHRAARDERWRTREEPLALVDALERETHAGAIIVVDCLTLWLTNLMLGDQPVEEGIAQLAAAVASLSGPVVFVSNEVGAGIVPDNRLARDFRDHQGRLNQAMAQACDAVILVAAGLPLQLKPVPRPVLAFA